MSPAQILFHRQLRDHLPVHPSHYELHKEWLLSAQQREEALSKRNQDLVARYNQSAHDLPPLTTGTRVYIQCKKQRRARWSKTGVVTECLPNRQYYVKVFGSGRTTLRNRRFLKPAPITHVPTSPFVSPAFNTPAVDQEGEEASKDSTVVATDETTANSLPDTAAELTAPTSSVDTPPANAPGPRTTVPRALKGLQTYNTPGLRESPRNAGGRRDQDT